jgi:hypothetical protein
MFVGTVNIIERKKRLHCGFKVKMGGVVRLASICNQMWHLDDKTHEAESSEVTCKTCLKMLARADENGKVKF